MKKIRWFYLISSLAITAVGIVLICVPEFIASVLGYIAGAGLILFGIAKVIRHFFSRADIVDSMLVGVLLAMFGFVIIRSELSNVSVVMNDIYMFVGILIFLDGVFKLKNAFQSRKAKQKDWIGVLVGALIVMAFGILIVANPFGTVNVTIIILGVSVLLDGLQNLYSVIRYALYAADAEREGSSDLVPVSGEVDED
ncbi:MAG: DUF308 domain-containing protein [Clostridia bacterium]|nr:DUF308 domain-containing protein [Clostridia bacterium]